MSSPTDRGRRLLPLFANHPLGRSAVTCTYRCGDSCARGPANTSDNEYFGDVVRDVLSRRGMLKAGTVLAAACAGVTSLTGTAAAKAEVGVDVDLDLDIELGGRRDGLNFEPVTPNTADKFVVPKGYRSEVVIRWGDPVLPGAPAFDFDHQTPEAQAKQFGFNNDFCGLVPLPGHNRWLMVSNHEYSSEKFMFKDWNPTNPDERHVRIGWEAMGLSVVVVERERRSGKLVPKMDRHYNRRITVNTEFRLAGPAAGSKYLRTSADPTGTKAFGTLNNCAGGVTPWGTILSGEENIDSFFGHGEKVTDPETRKRLGRYKLLAGASERKWERFDKRWDVSQETNETNRFGWIVEIDPLDPTSTPVKHTALGRFCHEGANVTIADDRRVVAYMGDDDKFEYIYKFVSDGRYLPGDSKRAREHNKKLLDSGTLYVAKFTGDSPASEIDGSAKLPSDKEFDGTGRWIPLAHNKKSFVDGFTAEEVYVFTRLAADKVGATRMDRAEDVQTNPRNGKVYAALTKNADRALPGKPAADEPNPRLGNKHGHIIEIEEHCGDHTAESFTWNLPLICGDPSQADSYFGGFDKTKVSPISCPDNVAFDDRGNLWITTDGNALKANDGLYAVPVEGRRRGMVKQFASVPAGAEACGPVITDRFVLVSVQHPGEFDGASANNPMSHWPDGGVSQPRAAVVAVWREDNGRIGE